jgi:oxygen-dependent protoporphyrinogen oxidase
VIVIGAGISGLACAYGLMRAGVDVGVLEARPRPGGSIESHHRDGFLLEWGPNSFARKPEAENLITDLGLEDELLRAPMRDHPRFIFKDGSLHEVPTGPLALLRTPLLSFRGKLRILREPFLRTRPPADESVADFVRRHLGPEVLDTLVAPFVSGIYAGDAEQMSLPGAFPLLHEWARARGSVIRGAIAGRHGSGVEPKPRRRRARRHPAALCSFRSGLGRLPEALAARLGDRLRCDAPVSDLQIERTDGGAAHWRITTRGDSGEESVWDASAVVIATPPHAAARFTRGCLPGASKALGAIEPVSLVVIHLGVPLDSLTHPPRGFGFLVPRSQGVRILGTLWTSSVFEGRAPEGHALLTIFCGGATDPDAVDLDDAAVTQVVQDDLRETMGWDGRSALVNIVRQRATLPSYHLGHVERIADIERAAESCAAPVKFLGNYRRGISIPDCIRQAAETAAAVAEQLEIIR